MSLLGNLFTSLNPFSTKTDRAEAQYSLIDESDRIRNRITSPQNKAATIRSVFHASPLKLSSETFDHYLQATGKSVTLSPKELRQFGTIQRAEAKNHSRLLHDSLMQPNTLMKITPSGLKPTTLNDMRDNDRAYLKDYFDVDRKPIDYMVTDPDLYLALGHFKMRSTSHLELVKSNNMLLPYGHVEHQINDGYNFNLGSPLNRLLSPLEKSGIAKPYRNKGSWQTYPVGVIKLNDGNIDTSEIEWNLSN